MAVFWPKGQGSERHSCLIVSLAAVLIPVSFYAVALSRVMAEMPQQVEAVCLAPRSYARGVVYFVCAWRGLDEPSLRGRANRRGPTLTDNRRRYLGAFSSVAYAPLAQGRKHYSGTYTMRDHVVYEFTA